MSVLQMTQWGVPTSTKMAQWDAQTFTSFFEHWSEDIRRQDHAGWRAATQFPLRSGSAPTPCDVVYAYLRMKLTERFAYTRRIGQAGWSFHAAALGASPHQIENAVAWADGYSEGSQSCPRASPGNADEQWWPCLTVFCGEFEMRVPFYCPALAVNNGRPWYCHRTRVFTFTMGALGPTIEATIEVTIVATPGPVVEECDDEVTILATPGPVVEECASSSQSSCVDNFEVVGDAETEGLADFEIVGRFRHLPAERLADFEIVD
jgi:hypothetical protein